MDFGNEFFDHNNSIGDMFWRDGFDFFDFSSKNNFEPRQPMNMNVNKSPTIKIETNNKDLVVAKEVTMAIPSCQGVFPLNIIPISEVITLNKNEIFHLNEKLGLIWRGREQQIDLAKNFIFFETSSIKKNFPNNISPKFKHRIDTIRKQENLLSYKSDDDFKKLKKYLPNKTVRTSIIPIKEFTKGNFAYVFNVIEVKKKKLEKKKIILTFFFQKYLL